MAIRKIMKIDEDKCVGCGLCVPGCAEGAIKIIDGKAKLVSDNLCDGIGNCIGHCPVDAIEIIEREAEEFDKKAVEEHKEEKKEHTHVHHKEKAHGHGCGCQGSRPMHIKRNKSQGAATGVSTGDVEIKIRPQLSQWPVQLKLVPENASYFNDRELLITADCVPFAYPNYHLDLLKDRSVVIGCPKLDDIEFYINKLTNIIKLNNITGIVVAHMEVPCCTGIIMAADEALKRSGKDIKIKKVKIKIDGGREG
ncbi:4Fe-4S binding protein [Wukongibacter baidiensis]|uniref:ATP-binding protein n=1 Tax=Wukongibacter baidiensis TaxID=1723361 RepID=UPI003D7F7380